jgi:NAD(P)-dependent dehydrogenase (short-subunit alcohol dehydrogenase family)
MLTKVLAKQKRITKQGSLVYIASISGNGNTATGLSTYGSSKAALSAFVKYAAVELSGKQIRCNTISPGRIETAFLQNGTMNAEDIQRDMERYPLRRYGRAEEVAQAAVYLLSDAAQWVTGTELKIDGGRTLV